MKLSKIILAGLLALSLAPKAQAATDAPAKFTTSTSSSALKPRPFTGPDAGLIWPGQKPPCFITNIDRSTANGTAIQITDKPAILFSMDSSSAVALGDFAAVFDSSYTAGATAGLERYLGSVYSAVKPATATGTVTGTGLKVFDPPRYAAYGLTALQVSNAASAGGSDKAHTEICWLPASGAMADRPVKGPFTTGQ